MSLFSALEKLIKVQLDKGDKVFFSFPQNEKGKVVVKKRIVRQERKVVLKAKVRPTITIRRKGGEKMKGTPQINEARELMDRVLNILRSEQAKSGQGLRGRELAISLTYMEEGCMRMIRSEHADKPYSPLLRLKEDKPEEPKAPEVPAQPAQQETAPANQQAQEQQPAQPAAGENQAPADQPATQVSPAQPADTQAPTA